MEQFYNEHRYQVGEIVYVFYRNPHTPDVANVQEAAIVKHPERPGELALFLYETYYPLNDEFAIFSSKEEAEQVYHLIFEDSEGGTELD